MEDLDLITVIICTYNSDWNKVERTINSVLGQTGVNIELIVADDGSNENFFEIIRKKIEKESITYQLITSENNQGTCKNLYNAIKHAKGRYVKDLGAGDCFYSCNSLAKWLQYMKKMKSKASFGQAVYYNHNEVNDEIRIIERMHHPCLMGIYYQGTSYKANQKQAYLILDDFPEGVSYFAEKEVLEKYLEQLIDKVIYGEDNVYRLMVADGIQIDFYDEKLIWYDYGEGISTSKGHEWDAILFKDMQSATRMILEEMNRDFFYYRYKFIVRFFERRTLINDFARWGLFPKTLIWTIKRKMQPFFTITDDVDTSFLKCYIEEKIE
ncbi:MAG: glycosyltransferase [Lachnospiraceae bacterium]|nr:glycosyltransferase [Lachnospiraceae bacterium]MDD7628499.1 glycosyltransferase [Lachnospiraceae bacterium]MDY4120025.1 glycosyltransferase [Lachnospiraceae bacterium]